MAPIRQITTFGESNKRKLRKYKKVRSIVQLRSLYAGLTDDAIYIQVASDYNTDANRQRQAQKESKDMFNNLPIVDTTQKSREERLRQKIVTIPNMPKEVTVKERERYHRKALGRAFEDIEYRSGVTFENMAQIAYETVVEKLASHDKSLNMNVHLFLQLTMKKVDKNTDEYIYLQFNLNSDFVERVVSPNQILQWAQSQVEKFKEKINSMRDSDLTLDKIDVLNVQISATNKVRGGSYVELPKWIQLKHCCVNIKNTDDRCILYSIVASEMYDSMNHKDKNMPRHYKHEVDALEAKLDGLKFPIDPKSDISKIEKLVSKKINVYRLDGNSVQVFYNTRERNENVVNLLLVEGETTDHFVWIRDLARLVCGKNSNKVYICSQCLAKTCASKEDLEKHLVSCMKHEAVACKLPSEEGNKLCFKNFGNSFMHPFSVFLDFESTLVPCEEKNAYQKHIPNSVGFKFNCIHDQFSESIRIINSDNSDALMEKLIVELEALACKSYFLTKRKTKYDPINVKLNEKHQLATSCEYCSETFNEDNYKVYHHDHITGQYIATICKECNHKHRYKPFLPIYVHNLKGYDAHFIVPNLNKYGSPGEVSCIANNEERYISFTKTIKVDEYTDKDGKYHEISYQLKFIDSFAFMSTSLEKLASNLAKGCGNDVKALRNVFRNVSAQFKDDTQFLHMISKGVYPYDYVTSYDVLHETSLPSYKSFYSKLADANVGLDDYQKAQTVWKDFKCSTFLDYHNLYLTSDVLLLADVWENFKAVCYRIYNLDVSYYLTAPSLSWDAFLKHKYDSDKSFYIELLTDMNMYLLVEESIRGGLSQISKRYAKANHPGLKSYDEKLQKEYILYLDANNLYGYAMSQYLPWKGFQWNYDEWTMEKVMAIPDDTPIGYLFEVHLHYPEHLHDHHNGYALAPENIVIKNSMLNGWQQEDRKETKVEKLVTNFHDKKLYGVNYRLLKLYIKLGLIVKEFHRVLQFEQTDFMKSYIMKNTNERKDAKNDFEKDFYKLMNNAVYGKTMENVRNRINFSLVTSEEKALRLRNTLKRYVIFNEDCVGVHQLKKEVKLCKPIAIGQCVLDQSKFWMNQFHYDFMLKKFERSNIDLLFTDTDSLCYHIKNQDPYKIIASNKDWFDLSGYPKNHPLYDVANKKAIGKFKDEAVDGHMAYISEFVGLRSKLYSYRLEYGNEHEVEEHHRCKGVKASIVRNLLTDQYKDTLFNRTNLSVIQQGFRSVKHQLVTERVEKIGLSCNDDKCFILDDNIHTFTIGHYKVSK